MTSRYRDYKEGCNSKGLPSEIFKTPEPKHYATAIADMDSFKQVCVKATEKIQELKAQGDVEALPYPDEVKPTPRQARRFRNKHGSAYKYGR